MVFLISWRNAPEPLRSVPGDSLVFTRAIPAAFVVGFGLDYEDYYRNLPYVGVLKPAVYLEK